EALKNCPVKQKLLLLDVTFPFTYAHAGIFQDDVAERLEPILKSAVTEQPGLCVLTACSPGQVSLASEELGHSVFAHFILQGLAGRADGVGGKKDSRVSMRELAEFVADRTNRWAWHNRHLHQVPHLFAGNDRDVTLTVAEEKSPTVTPLDRDYPGF